LNTILIKRLKILRRHKATRYIKSDTFLTLCVQQTDSLTWALTRKKADEPSKEKLNRVLTLFDLTALGTGATLGCGVYVLAGAVASSIAGPAVVLSFIIAAVVSAFSGEDLPDFYGIHF